MRVLVCGSREWTDSMVISYQLALIFGTDRERVVIHGNCGDLGARPPRGADVLAGWCGVGVGARVEVFAVDHAAGPRRNSRMLVEGKPDKGLAFGPLWIWRGAKRTGTGDMVKKMLAAGVPVRWLARPEGEVVDLTTMPEPIL